MQPLLILCFYNGRVKIWPVKLINVRMKAKIRKDTSTTWESDKNKKKS